MPKKHCPGPATLLSSTGNNSARSQAVRARFIMTNSMFKRGALLILALAISAGFLDSARAQQAVSAAADMTGLTLAAETSSTSTSTSSTSEVTSKSGPDIGIGIFSPFPFKLTLDVQNGYDDNVTTSNQFKQGSGFTEGGVSLSYDFGDARAQ